MEIGFYTDTGYHREINQDNYYVNKDVMYPYFVIADGMGGKNAGEVASKEAIRHISEYVNMMQKHGKIMDVPHFIKEVFSRANKFVYQMSLDFSQYSGMGTTLVFAIQVEQILYIGNVGDSRLYCVTDDEIIQLTRDHSIVASLLEKGEISENEAQNHPQKNIITRALGVDDTVEVDVFEHILREKDLFLMCTDGLSNRVSKESIMEILCQSISLQQKAEQLIGLANKVDGTDNATVILFKLDTVVRGDK